MALKGGEPVSPTLMARVKSTITAVAGGVSTTIRGVADAWLGPLQPLPPLSQESQGRIFDYPVGYNTRVPPKSLEGSGISFDNMIAVADNCDIVRILIEERKDQLEAMDWQIRPKDAEKDGADDQRVKELELFFRSPDRLRSWEQWLRMVTEEVLVTDALSINRRKTKGGKPYAFELIDGATIVPKIDEDGRSPPDPDPAYQQIIKGVPMADYTRSELLYYPRNQRVRKLYGYSPVEQIIVTINIAIRRALKQLQYFTDGNLPDALIGTPAEWTTEQVIAFQKHWDSVLEGNTAAQRHGKFVPGDAKNVHQMIQPALSDKFDEWIARIACFAFKVSAQNFVSMMNRATAEQAQESSNDAGVIPMMKYIKGFMDVLIAEDFGYDDLEFAWIDGKETDPKVEQEVLCGYQKTAAMTANEVREKLGLDPDPNPNANRLGLITATGWVPLDESPEEKQAKQDALAALQKPKEEDDGKEPPPDDGKKSAPPEKDGAEKLQKKNAQPSQWTGRL